jgi:hypothetical protein
MDKISLSLNSSSMSSFSMFALLYMTAYFVEIVDPAGQVAQGMQGQIFALASVLVLTIAILTGITRVKFLVFLYLATAALLSAPFPGVPNHANIMIYCNLLMIVATIYSFARYRSFATDNDYFEMVRPVLGASLILVYCLAGFNKLNSDFLNPEVSCAGALLSEVVELGSLVTSNMFSASAAFVLAAGALFILWKRISGTHFVAPRLRVYTLLLILCVGVVLYSALLLVRPHLGIPADLVLAIVLATAVFTILWELVGGLLLAIPKFQAPMLLVFGTMHAVLAMIGFADFSVLAFSLLFTFVPSSYYQVINSYANLRFPRLRIHRAHAYFIINLLGNLLGAILLGGILTGTHIQYSHQVSGLSFVLAALILTWPILSMVFSSSRRPVWGGVPVLNRNTPKFMFVFLVLLFLYGMTPYLGLRTTGTFTMFSNLRTEGILSNHLLLSSNPLKVWGYQEDVVRLREIRDGRWSEEKSLPIVEFRKRILEWTQAGRTVPLVLEYRGETYSTEDVVKDPVWRTEKRNWEMMLLDFRDIQPEGPTQCRW